LRGWKRWGEKAEGRGKNHKNHKSDGEDLPLQGLTQSETKIIIIL
jgi:hypothetical protein